MNKRSAMAVAAGLVLAMIVAGVALATGITGPSSDAGTTVAVPSEAQEPIVRTVTRTIEVHETGEPTISGQAPVIVRSSEDPGSAVSDDPQGTYGDDENESDDEYESDYEDEDESDEDEDESDDEDENESDDEDESDDEEEDEDYDDD